MLLRMGGADTDNEYNGIEIRYVDIGGGWGGSGIQGDGDDGLLDLDGIAATAERSACSYECGLRNVIAHEFAHTLINRDRLENGQDVTTQHTGPLQRRWGPDQEFDWDCGRALGNCAWPGFEH